MPEELAEYKAIQNHAKVVLEEIKRYINSDSCEKTIASDCVQLLKYRGVSETWYYKTPALVLLGSRSCLSISGKKYLPANESVGQRNLVTIDLSPLFDGFWGDCARSFAVEAGKVVDSPNNSEFCEGIDIQYRLHQEFRELADPKKTFEQLFLEMNSKIQQLGYENLDFLGNVGHTIEKRREDRIYFEKGNKKLLKDSHYFTFEPHIRKQSANWGFKHENIYYFGKNGKVVEL